MLQLDGAPASGSVAVEATLTLLDIPFRVIDAETWVDVKARDKAAPGLAPVVRRIDAEPRLQDFWERRLPFDGGWED